MALGGSEGVRLRPTHLRRWEDPEGAPLSQVVEVQLRPEGPRHQNQSGLREGRPSSRSCRGRAHLRLLSAAAIT